MPLTFDPTAIKDLHTNYPPGENDRMNSTTETLIFTTMAIDMGGWATPTGADTAYRRYVEFWTAYGDDPATLPLTRADFHGHIGIRTNVATTTPAKWAARLRKLLAQKHTERCPRRLTPHQHSSAGTGGRLTPRSRPDPHHGNGATRS